MLCDLWSQIGERTSLNNGHNVKIQTNQLCFLRFQQCYDCCTVSADVSRLIQIFFQLVLKDGDEKQKEGKRKTLASEIIFVRSFITKTKQQGHTNCAGIIHNLCHRLRDISSPVRKMVHTLFLSSSFSPVLTDRYYATTLNYEI